MVVAMVVNHRNGPKKRSKTFSQKKKMADLVMCACARAGWPAEQAKSVIQTNPVAFKQTVIKATAFRVHKKNIILECWVLKGGEAHFLTSVNEPVLLRGAVALCGRPSLQHTLQESRFAQNPYLPVI